MATGAWAVVVVVLLAGCAVRPVVTVPPAVATAQSPSTRPYAEALRDCAVFWWVPLDGPWVTPTNLPERVIPERCRPPSITPPLVEVMAPSLLEGSIRWSLRKLPRLPRLSEWSLCHPVWPGCGYEERTLGPLPPSVKKRLREQSAPPAARSASRTPLRVPAEAIVTP